MAAERVTGGTLGDSIPDWLTAVQQAQPGRQTARPAPVPTCVTCGATDDLTWGTCRACATKEGIAILEESLRVVIPASFVWARFGAPELTKRVRIKAAIEQAQNALDGNDGSTLVGPAGSGKTSLACAMLAAWVQRDDLGNHAAQRAARALRFTSAFALAKARSMAKLGDEAGPVRAAMDASLLVIDDLGAEPAYANSAIPEVIHERHAAGELTIVTTGFAAKDIADRYGAGIARRVFERAAIVKCG